jgi:hypothetical protein
MRAHAEAVLAAEGAGVREHDIVGIHYPADRRAMPLYLDDRVTDRPDDVSHLIGERNECGFGHASILGDT